MKEELKIFCQDLLESCEATEISTDFDSGDDAKSQGNFDFDYAIYNENDDG